MTAKTLQLTDFKPFDVAELLDDEDTMQAYLNEFLTDGTEEEFIQALNDVARARSMTAIAEDTGIGRTTLYKSLQTNKIQFTTLNKVLHSLGLQLQVTRAV